MDWDDQALAFVPHSSMQQHSVCLDPGPGGPGRMERFLLFIDAGSALSDFVQIHHHKSVFAHVDRAHASSYPHGKRCVFDRVCYMHRSGDYVLLLLQEMNYQWYSSGSLPLTKHSILFRSSITIAGHPKTAANEYHKTLGGLSVKSMGFTS